MAALQEAQLAGGTLTVPGYHTAATLRKARGRRAEGPVRGEDVAILVKDGFNFQTIRESPLQPQDDTTEWCAVRVILRAPTEGGSTQTSTPRHLDVYNIYRPPFRTSVTDQRVDRFSLVAFPAQEDGVILGAMNGNHPA